MKITHCTLIIFVLICIWAFYYRFFGLNQDHKLKDFFALKNSSISAKNKKKIHIPKFMLELYENNKNNRRNRADVVKSLIPKHTSEYFDWLSVFTIRI